MELQGKLGANFLQPSHPAISIEHVTMTTDKDKISLIVKGDNLSTCELWDVWEEGDKETTNSVSQASGEIVKDQLGSVGAGATMVLDLLAQLGVGQLENCCWAFRKFDNAQGI